MSVLPIFYRDIAIGDGCEIRRATLEIIEQIRGMYDGKIPVIFRHIEIMRTWAMIEIETSIYYTSAFGTMFTKDNKYRTDIRQVSLCGSIRVLFAVIRM